MDYRTEAQEEKKSKYNSALPQLYRIDNLWQSYNYNKRKGNLIGANQDLDCIFGELSGDINDMPTEKINRQFMFLIIKWRHNKNIFNQIIMRKETWIRKLQNDQGKGTSYLDPNADSLEE